VKVVGIVGSPRRGGNTEILTQIALDEIRKEDIGTELIRLAEKKIAPCDGCRGCTETGKCHIKDDFASVFAKMKEADGIILATPVYYGAATPQIVSLISRFEAAQDKPLRRKVGGPIVVARRAGHTFTLAQLLFFFMINEMIVPGSSYWNVAFGRQKGDVLKDKEGIRTIKNFAHNTAWLIKRIHSNPAQKQPTRKTSKATPGSHAKEHTS
jgi:multimeric flavodoxin WrbA